MSTYFIIFIPVLLGVCEFWITSEKIRKLLLISGAIFYFIASLLLIIFDWKSCFGSEFFYFDSLGKLFLILTAVLFLLITIYTLGYLNSEESEVVKRRIFYLSASKNSVFTGCMLIFLSTMTMAFAARSVGILWISVEATTLVSAPLIYYHKNKYSLEATWKYLITCSVGIGLALIGNIAISMALVHPEAGLIPFTLSSSSFLHNGPAGEWLKAAFIFFIVGYGTKMGLSPMHTWLPDVYGESPSLVSALFSGILLNCALLAILRIYGIMEIAGLGNYSREIFVLFGLISLLTASIFIIQQPTFKRLIAYSSIENIGIIILGFGIGTATSDFGSMLQAINHSFSKSVLFLTAGIIYMIYKKRGINDVSGIAEISPMTAFLWFAGFLAISGVPPFGIFISEFMIIKSSLFYGNVLVPIVFIISLIIIFAGMASAFIKMTFGRCEDLNCKKSAASIKSKYFVFIPPLVLLLLTFILGIYIPNWLTVLIHSGLANF